MLDLSETKLVLFFIRQDFKEKSNADPFVLFLLDVSPDILGNAVGWKHQKCVCVCVKLMLDRKKMSFLLFFSELIAHNGFLWKSAKLQYSCRKASISNWQVKYINTAMLCAVDVSVAIGDETLLKYILQWQSSRNA